jgi:CRP-like cAMP-binding protein
VPLQDQEHYLRYTNFLYWALSCSSAGAAGDVLGVTHKEKIFEIILLLFFKVYVAFITAEVATAVSSLKIAYSENLEKTETYNKWMENMKLSVELRQRVASYHELKWKKFKGLDENEILNDLPSSLKDNISENILRGMIEKSDLFSSVEKGFTMSFIKKLKFLVFNKEEYIFRKGDIAEDVYFIVEGTVGVMDLDQKTIIVRLKNGALFGEMGVIQFSAGTRSRSIKALDDVSLVMINIEDFRELCDQYPAAHQMILQKINERNKQNQQRQEAKTPPPVLKPEPESKDTIESETKIKTEAPLLTANDDENKGTSKSQIDKKSARLLRKLTKEIPEEDETNKSSQTSRKSKSGSESDNSNESESQSGSESGSESGSDKSDKKKRKAKKNMEIKSKQTIESKSEKEDQDGES